MPLYYLLKFNVLLPKVPTSHADIDSYAHTFTQHYSASNDFGLK